MKGRYKRVGGRGRKGRKGRRITGSPIIVLKRNP